MRLSKSKEIQKIIENENNEEDNTKEKEITWNRMRINIELILGVKPEYDCTVSDFIDYVKIIEERNGK